MGMQINTNLSALNSYRNLSTTQNDMSKSLEKLSSGLRINRAADDAAGLAISEGLKSQIGGLTVAARNAQDGISVVQTAEGTLSEVHSILQRMRDLAVQAGNDSNNTESRKAITSEATALNAELDRIGRSTNFNGINLLDGSASSLKFQVGAGDDSNSQISVTLSTANVVGIATDLDSGDLTGVGATFAFTANTSAAIGAMAGTSYTFATDGTGPVTTSVTVAIPAAPALATGDDVVAALNGDSNFAANFTASVIKDANGVATGITVRANDGSAIDIVGATGANLNAGSATGNIPGGLDFTSASAAQASINLLDKKIAIVSSVRADLGAVQNRFEHTINNLNVSKENLTASRSRITDTDMASEMVNFTRSSILSQAGTAMLAQANQSNQGVLQLLR
jgi:flagellin